MPQWLRRREAARRLARAQSLALLRDFAPNLSRRLVGAESHINRVSQEPGGGPGQIGNLDDKLRLRPMHARKNERRPEAGFARRHHAERRARSGQGIKAATQIGEHLVRHARPHPAGINELAVVSVITEQKRAEDVLREDVSADEAFAEAGRVRREDLLVHMALQQFPGSPKYRSLPRSIQADIKAFFGSQASALLEARQLLFSTGDIAGIRADVEVAAAAGSGGLRGANKFRFLSSTLPRLPARLRVLVGCAEVLQGGVLGCDLVDIDLKSPRVAMLTCDDMEKPVPFIKERIKVDLGRLKVFADRREPETSPVYFKSKFLPRDQAGRERQIEFESVLTATGLFETDAPEPKWSEVRAALGSLPTLKREGVP
jgi:DNA phosphorothioation-associated putative methyltransferase